MVEKTIFLQSGKKEVIHFIVVPQRFATDIEAINALQIEVRNYELDCGKGYNKYLAPDNPFVAIIIHGINE